LGDFKRRRLHKRVCERRKRVLRLSQGLDQSERAQWGPGEGEWRVLQVNGRKRYVESSPSKMRSKSAIANARWRERYTLCTVKLRDTVYLALRSKRETISAESSPSPRTQPTTTQYLHPPSSSHALKRNRTTLVKLVDCLSGTLCASTLFFSNGTIITLDCHRLPAGSKHTNPESE
jgi:hypothetical protein